MCGRSQGGVEADWHWHQCHTTSVPGPPCLCFVSVQAMFARASVRAAAALTRQTPLRILSVAGGAVPFGASYSSWSLRGAAMVVGAGAGLIGASVLSDAAVHAEGVNPLRVFSELDTKAKQSVIRTCVVYPHTSLLSTKGDTLSVRAAYEGTPASFAKACKAVCGSIDLKAAGMQQAVKDVLEVVSDPEFFVEIGLDAADGIVLQRMGRTIVRLTRAESIDDCGRTVFIELKDVRSRAAADSVAHAKSKALDYVTVLIVAASAVGVSYLWETLKGLTKKGS